MGGMIAQTLAAEHPEAVSSLVSVMSNTGSRWSGQPALGMYRFLLRQAPLFGIGVGKYEDEVGLVAHNSFVHAYTELGIFGGALFLGAFVYPLGTLHRLGVESSPHMEEPRGPALVRRERARVLDRGLDAALLEPDGDLQRLCALGGCAVDEDDVAPSQA